MFVNKNSFTGWLDGLRICNVKNQDVEAQERMVWLKREDVVAQEVMWWLKRKYWDKNRSKERRCDVVAHEVMWWLRR